MLAISVWKKKTEQGKRDQQYRERGREQIVILKAIGKADLVKKETLDQ